MEAWLTTTLAMLSPVIEGRGGIPLGAAMGLNLWLVFAIALISAIIIFVVLRAILNPLSHLIPVEKLIPKHNRRVVDKYGPFGIYLISALPLPFTGVYSSTALSWFFKIRTRTAFVAVMMGTVTSNLIVLSITLGAVL